MKKEQTLDQLLVSADYLNRREAINREINMGVIKPVVHVPENKKALKQAKIAYKKAKDSYKSWVKEFTETLSACKQPNFNLKLSINGQLIPMN